MKSHPTHHQIYNNVGKHHLDRFPTARAAYREEFGPQPPPSTGEEITVDSLYTDKASYSRYATVYATATMHASQDTTLPRVVIAVRHRNTGGNYDFPLQTNFLVKATGSTLKSNRTLNTSGIYDYWVAYYKDDSWHALTSKKSFTIY